MSSRHQPCQQWMFQHYVLYPRLGCQQLLTLFLQQLQSKQTEKIRESDSELLDRSTSTVRFTSTEEWPPRDRNTVSYEFNYAVLFTSY